MRALWWERIGHDINIEKTGGKKEMYLRMCIRVVLTVIMALKYCQHDHWTTGLLDHVTHSCRRGLVIVAQSGVTQMRMGSLLSGCIHTYISRLISF